MLDLAELACLLPGMWRDTQFVSVASGRCISLCILSPCIANFAGGIGRIYALSDDLAPARETRLGVAVSDLVGTLYGVDPFGKLFAT